MTMECMECSTPFTSRKPNQAFCCSGHKSAFWNRQAKRGKVLLPILMTMCADRREKPDSEGGEACSQARAWVYEMAELWRQEDKAAGRPSMRPMVLTKMEMCWSPVGLDL